MRCPFCKIEDTQVKDSRPSDEGFAIKRRRFCSNCNSRFNTTERIQMRELSVIKKNGQKRPFDRDKLTKSISMAARKRSISNEQIEITVDSIVHKLESIGDQEIATSLIGDLTMDSLMQLDQVAYVRFASVYKDFVEAKDFEKFIHALKEKK